MQDNAALTLAFALTAGMLAHAVSHHLRLPSIVVLLVAGVLLGPDGAGLVYPQTLGPQLHTLVRGAVAVILFEGGLRLQLRRLRREPRAIRRLVTWGALLSTLGGAAAAWWILGWSVRNALLFGTLMMVTGPTVVTPLLARLRVHRHVATVLEAEGVLIDAVGAVTAAVALDVALHPSQSGILLAGPEVAVRLAVGALAGLGGGALLSLLLRFRGLVAGELRNVFTLAVVLLITAASNALLSESGIAAATVAGITLANMPVHGLRELANFKQQFVHLLIGMLFLLLAADVRLSSVTALGLRGALTVAVLLGVVRPASAFLCTIGSGLRWRERVLIAWISPRGVVAAAVASLFAFRLQAAGVGGGLELRALVFATIVLSVVWCSLTGATVARILGLRRQNDRGWLVLGANSLARRLAGLLDDGAGRAVIVDYDPHLVRASERSGLRALQGNALDDRLLTRAELELRTGAVGLTSNPEANLLFAQHVQAHAPEMRSLVAVRDDLDGVTPALVRAQGARVLFAGATDVERWSKLLKRGQAEVEWWRCDAGTPQALRMNETRDACVPLVCRRGDHPHVVGDDSRIRRGEQVAFLLDRAVREHVHGWLREMGFSPADEGGGQRTGGESQPAPSRGCAEPPACDAQVAERPRNESSSA